MSTQHQSQCSENETEGTVRLTIELSDSAAAQEFLQCLGQASSNVSFSVDCIATEGQHPCVLPIDHVSERQLEAASLAIEKGYYDTPREASLSELADDLDVTSSAVSQRLNGIERKLIRLLVESCGTTTTDE